LAQDEQDAIASQISAELVDEAAKRAFPTSVAALKDDGWTLREAAEEALRRIRSE